MCWAADSSDARDLVLQAATASPQHCSLPSMMAFFLGFPPTSLTGNMGDFPITSISLFLVHPVLVHPLYQIENDSSLPLIMPFALLILLMMR